MATTLTIRGVPPALHAQLKRRADEHRRSLNSEVLQLLEEAASFGGQEAGDRQAALSRIDRLRESGPTIQDDPAALKRKMREVLAAFPETAVRPGRPAG